jgi:hypothetical protein
LSKNKVIFDIQKRFSKSAGDSETSGCEEWALRPRFFLLVKIERAQGNARHLHDLETHPRKITDSVAFSTEPRD